MGEEVMEIPESGVSSAEDAKNPDVLDIPVETSPSVTDDKTSLSDSVDETNKDDSEGNTEQSQDLDALKQDIQNGNVELQNSIGDVSEQLDLNNKSLEEIQQLLAEEGETSTSAAEVNESLTELVGSLQGLVYINSCMLACLILVFALVVGRFFYKFVADRLIHM